MKLRISMNIKNQPGKVTWVIYKNTPEVLLKKAPRPVFLLVDCFGIRHEKKPELLADRFGDIQPFQVLKIWKVFYVLNPNQQMKMVRQQTVSICIDPVGKIMAIFS
ncbi:MAG: hypothetical protein IPN74_02600 [Haliscomenobacter sp.]|nr:hypothetical protein [Haliscomenobacter sp.]